jgi:nucleoside-diphosphate-sugar epimerase
MRIGIIGASGFVGSALCERLHFLGHNDYIPFVRSSANAWRIARLPIRLQWLDLRDRNRVVQAVSGCDVVVNCALDSGDPQAVGLKNLLYAVRMARVRRFVHLSSIAIYGRNPAPESATESAAPNPGDNEYGRLKLRDDRLVAELDRAGVPSVILCPGNIGGPYSPFMRGLAERLGRGPLPLVDGGRHPSNIIHVDNLVEAILAVARATGGSGQRYFVNEIVPVPWRQVFDDLSRLLAFEPVYTEVDRAEILPLLEARMPAVGVAAHARVLMSGEFRDALSRLPVFGWVNQLAGRAFTSLPARYQGQIRERLTWPVPIEKVASEPALNDRYVTVQARCVYHSPRRLQEIFAWQPPLDYGRGMVTTVAWLRFAGVGAIKSVPDGCA